MSSSALLAGKGWSLTIAAAWSAKTCVESAYGSGCKESVAITPATRDALLRITPDERGIMPAAEWVEAVAKLNRIKGRSVLCADCGDFNGFLVEFSAGEEWLRGWALHAGSIPLDVTYRCNLAAKGRDDQIVESMVNSLRLAKKIPTARSY
jgi:hypothetical protein